MLASSVDTANDLMTFAAGPSILGTAALIAYAKKVFDGPDRSPTAGWLAIGAGAVVAVWLAVFVVWAAPTVFGSWSADGEPDVSLVLLSVTWSIAIALIALVLRRAPMAGQYLAESYPTGEGPWPVRLIRSLLG